MKSIFKLYILKLAILSLTMIFISFGASANNVEELYKYCKPFQNNGLTLDGLNIKQQRSGLLCATYIRAMIDMGGQNCVYLNEMYKSTSDKIGIQVLSSFHANDRKAPLNAVITSFVIFAENNTSKWKYSPASYVKEFINKNHPCKLEE